MTSSQEREDSANPLLRSGRGVVVRMMKRISVAVIAVTALVPSLAHAQQRKKITLDDLVIEGNIQKPEAFFILPRSNLDLSDLQRREDLKARIVEAVAEAPF
jgi:hypothetical protein